MLWWSTFNTGQGPKGEIVEQDTCSLYLDIYTMEVVVCVILHVCFTQCVWRNSRNNVLFLFDVHLDPNRQRLRANMLLSVTLRDLVRKISPWLPLTLRTEQVFTPSKFLCMQTPYDAAIYYKHALTYTNCYLKGLKRTVKEHNFGRINEERDVHFFNHCYHLYLY